MLWPALAFAQQSAYTIKGDVRSFKKGDRIFLSYKENGKQHLDSTVVKNGAFTFKGTIAGLGVGYICRNDNPAFANFLYDSATIFVQPGDILVTTTDSLLYANVSGTKLNQDNSELESALSELSKQQRISANKFDELTPEQQADNKFTGALLEEDNRIYHAMEPIKFAFINAHPNSYVSLLTLERMVNRSPLKLVAGAFENLSAENKTSPLGKAIGTAIKAAKRSQIGVTAPAFTLLSATGKQVSLSDFKGKYVLVDFWASWCGPCRDENPNVVAAYEKYNAQNFTVLSISIDNKNAKDAWLQAIKQDKLPWAQVTDNYKPAAMVKDLYGITTIPANVLIGPSGKIVAKNIKGNELHTTLKRILDK
ncbi:thiol:disulfide interchange protein [Mucilaginibacter phyllosphaerae]|nr:thiol:disulfide interchange protein [Mucilaginibacter phyllosphaerae]